MSTSMLSSKLTLQYYLLIIRSISYPLNPNASSIPNTAKIKTEPIL